MNPKTVLTKRLFIKIIDNMSIQMESYSSLGMRFEIFVNLQDKDPDKIKEQVTRLAKAYPDDLEVDSPVKNDHSQGYMHSEKSNF